MSKQQIINGFGEAMQQLNSQVWLLLALCEQSAGFAKTLTPLDGMEHKKVLEFLFPHATSHRASLRLRNKHLAADLEELCVRSGSWLPGYAVVLVKSLIEGTSFDLIEHAIKSDPTVSARFVLYRKSHGMGKIGKKKAIEALASAAARGDAATLSNVIDTSPKSAEFLSMQKVLNTYNHVRNRLAHDLGDEFTKGPSVSVQQMRDFMRTAQKLVNALAACV